jgi:DNA polymerase III epsilon subunit-like protein
MRAIGKRRRVMTSLPTHARFAAIDVETTGLSPDDDHVIEVGAVVCIDGCVLSSFSAVVRHCLPVPPRVTQLTGLRTRDVLRGATATTVVGQLVAMLDGVEHCVAYNAPFDVAFLHKLFRAAQTPVPKALRAIADVLPVAKRVLPQLPHHKLVDVAAALQVPLPSHRALDDARCCADVAWALSQPDRHPRKTAVPDSSSSLYGRAWSKLFS